MSVDATALMKQLEQLQKQVAEATASGRLIVTGPEPIQDEDTPDGARAALTRFHASVAHNPDTIHRALANHSLLVNDLYDKVAVLQDRAQKLEHKEYPPTTHDDKKEVNKTEK